LLYDSGDNIPTLDQLGYLPEQVGMINVMRRQTSGINVLSGATGSGKSTTLVSVMDTIIKDARKEGLVNKENDAEEFLGISVVTIEDPPEYKIHGATQTPLLADKSDEASIRRVCARIQTS
jgi:type II secretory ATPase GspE/PulE/Tfp pilus assembly ATPase PilB-like protein